MTTDFARATVGIATRQGRRPHNCDAATFHRHPDENGILAVALVDGIGNSEEIAKTARLCAEAAARAGARRRAVPGVMAAALLVEHPDEFHDPDGVIALAVCEPGQPVVIAHVGDVRAYSWNGTALQLHTTDHTKANRLRMTGQAEQATNKSAKVVTNTLAHAAYCTVALAETTDEVTILLSDGAHNAIAEQEITEILLTHSGNAQLYADSIVETAHHNSGHDDATAAVIIHSGPLHRDGITKLGR